MSSRNNELSQVKSIIAQDLHERAFGEKSKMNAERLSLAQMQYLQKQATQHSQLAIARANFRTKYFKATASNALVEGLSALDINSPSYQKQKAGLLQRYSPGVNDPGVRSILKDHKELIDGRIKAETERAAGTFTGPANTAWNEAYKATGGNMTFANKMAEAEQGKLTRVQKLVTDPTLDPAIRARLYDGKTFNTDDTLLTQGEVDVQTKAGKVTLGNSHIATLGALDGVIKTLGAQQDGEAPEAAAARKNALTALQAHTEALRTASAPEGATPPGAADQAFNKYLGVKRPAAPTTTVATAPTVPLTDPTIAPTPAPLPTPAPTPKPAPVLVAATDEDSDDPVE